MNDAFIEIYINLSSKELETANKINWLKALNSYEVKINDYDIDTELKFLRIWIYPIIYADDYVNFTKNYDIEYITDTVELIMKKKRCGKDV